MIFLKVIVLLIGFCVSPRYTFSRHRLENLLKKWQPILEGNRRISLKSVEGENSEDKLRRKNEWVKSLPELAESEENAFCRSLEAVKTAYQSISSLEHVRRYSLDVTMPVQPNIKFNNANPDSIRRLKQFVKRNAEDIAVLETMRIRDIRHKAGAKTRALQFGGLDHTSRQILRDFDKLVVIEPYARYDASSAPKIPLNDCLRSSGSVTHIEAQGSPEEYFKAFKESNKEKDKFDLVTITGPYPLAAAMIILPYIRSDTIINVNANIAREELVVLRDHYIIESNVEDEDFPMRQKRAMVMQSKPSTGQRTRVLYTDFIGPEFDDSNIDEAERLMESLKRTFDGFNWNEYNELNLRWQICESNILRHTSKFISLVEKESDISERIHQVEDFCKKIEPGVENLLNDHIIRTIVQTLKSEIKRSKVPLFREHPLFNIVSGFQNTAAHLSIWTQKLFVGGQRELEREHQLKKDIEYCKKTKNYIRCITPVFSLLYADLIKFVHLGDLD